MGKIYIWTDGSARSNGERYGGAGVYILDNDKEYFISKGYCPTTVSRMEIMALILALRAINPSIECEVKIFSDSQYVVNSFNKGWIDKWLDNGFVGVKNSDLWIDLLEIINNLPKMKMEIEWVKGHCKELDDDIIYGNNIADMLSSYKNFEEYEKDLGYEVR